jgi:hypothetical protein
MPKPLNPIAAGVASALMSLRRHAGLRGDRLTGTEPALDTLAGLGRVKKLIAAGDPQGEAIVRAVSDAVSTLEPTHSIVADVSLGLELSKRDLPESEVYADELGRRREALLKNWARLHELRSAPLAAAAPTLRTLRLEIERDSLSALAVALTDDGLPGSQLDLATQRPTDGVAVGADGSAEPDSLSADGASGQAALAQRDNRPRALPPLPHSPTPLILDEFRRIAKALRDALLVDGKSQGWPHDLRPGSTPSTATATSFALKALLLLEGFLTADLKPVVEHLRKRTAPADRTKLEGYAARSQKEPRPETTAVVLDTLHRIDGTRDYGKLFEGMKNGLHGFERTRPFILATVLQTSAQLGCDPDLTHSLVRDLLDARQQSGDLMLWSEKYEKNLVGPVPSVAHTARAVCALIQARQVRKTDYELGELDTEVESAVEQAAVWLAEQQDLASVSESIDRQLPDGVEAVYVRHFTAAWVVKALVSAGLPASHPAVSAGVTRIWSEYSIPTALWSWVNGDVPVWMTLDAVEALRLASMATTIPSGGGLGV